MNKILMISCVVLMMSSVAMADETATETCANGAGTVVIGSVTGHKYCVSKQQMNWWNAHAWCDGQNRRLVDKSDCACSDITADCSGDKCPEFTGIGTQRCWTAQCWKNDEWRDTHAYNVSLSSGYFGNNGSIGRGEPFSCALCY